MAFDATNRKEQRNFGLLMAGALTAIGLFRWWRHGGEAPLWLFAVAAGLAVLGLVFPRSLRWPLYVWFKFALALNWVMTRILLALAFILLITPTRFLVKWFGEDPLKREWLPDADTYWEEPDEHPDELERYLNQF
jgi:Saxitoxin biosynthesis operon protein SxtJ